MGLETGTGIGDLVPTNPLSTDAVSSGDDHIRLIKTVMQSITFLKSIQTFTASGTWTRPANVKKILIYCLGGGAGGNNGQVASYGGGGGSGGGIAIKLLDVSAIPSATVTIGASSPPGGPFAVHGNDTSFVTPGPVIQCLGRRGMASTATYQHGAAAAPRGESVGDIVFTGGDGSHGTLFITGSAGIFYGGKGGGQGGARSEQNAEANSGGGGGGGAVSSGAFTAGGWGAAGYCVVLEYGW